METYGKILMIASPIFFVFVLAEKLYGWHKMKHPFKGMDMLSSLSSGYTNSVKDVLGLSVSIISYGYMVEHWAVFHIQSSVWVYVIAFFVLDFNGYWVHRIDHKINFFWNAHVIHHSSEEFNLACALRQSISSFVRIFTIFLLPAALLGIDKNVIAVIAPIHLFAQFWYHTVYIGKLGLLEHIITTPSHHRVHHAINTEYMDKNLGQVFIFWDKLFGTFQAELPHVPPVYGISRPARTWNPFKINFQHIWLLVQDAYRTQNWADKLQIWFMPTGWRPNDVVEKYPVYKIAEPYTYQPYAPEISKPMYVWTWVQFLVTFSFLMYFYNNIANIWLPMTFIYGGFLFLSVYAYTELMDQNRWAMVFEVTKNLLGLYLVYDGWFGLADSSQMLVYLIGVYFVVATIICTYFCLKLPEISTS